MSYRHEQTGHVLAGVLAAVGLVFGYLAASPNTARPLFISLAAIFLATALCFQRLNVVVDDRALRWSLTFGWPGGTIPLDDIASVQVIPVTFWMGIGIHITLRGWLWNVAVGEGVQIVRKSNRVPIVLGTNDCQGLMDALRPHAAK